jgi:hypothetical protein
VQETWNQLILATILYIFRTIYLAKIYWVTLSRKNGGGPRASLQLLTEPLRLFVQRHHAAIAAASPPDTRVV